ncbi:hypothetical protein Ancab_035170 [Ancistrocladus abbreviatus]
MELQLGLALPVSNSVMKESDFKNNYCYYSSVNCSEEGYGSSLSSDDDGFADKDWVKKRCRFDDDAFEADSAAADVPKTLPLLVWNKEPNEEDDKPQEVRKDCALTINENGGEGDCVLGWPPIKSYRKKICHQNYNGRLPAENGGIGGGGGVGGEGLSLTYVKVQMEGVLITRKMNLRFLEQHHSYETLTCSLVGLFGRGRDSVDGYTLTYQDKEGNWLLAGDVPWRTFIQSIRRLKLRKNC